MEQLSERDQHRRLIGQPFGQRRQPRPRPRRFPAPSSNRASSIGKRGKVGPQTPPPWPDGPRLPASPRARARASEPDARASTSRRRSSASAASTRAALRPHPAASEPNRRPPDARPAPHAAGNAFSRAMRRQRQPRVGLLIGHARAAGQQPGSMRQRRAKGLRAPASPAARCAPGRRQASAAPSAPGRGARAAPGRSRQPPRAHRPCRRRSAATVSASRGRPAAQRPLEARRRPVRVAVPGRESRPAPRRDRATPAPPPRDRPPPWRVPLQQPVKDFTTRHAPPARAPGAGRLAAAAGTPPAPTTAAAVDRTARSPARRGARPVGDHRLHQDAVPAASEANGGRVLIERRAAAPRRARTPRRR